MPYQRKSAVEHKNTAIPHHEPVKQWPEDFDTEPKHDADDDDFIPKDGEIGNDEPKSDDSEDK